MGSCKQTLAKTMWMFPGFTRRVCESFLAGKDTLQIRFAACSNSVLCCGYCCDISTSFLLSQDWGPQAPLSAAAGKQTSQQHVSLECRSTKMQTPTTPHQGPPPHPRHDPVPLCMAKKGAASVTQAWVRLTHAHQNLSAEQQGVVGGELMVSAIIKGTPQQCLGSLTNSSSSSTCGNSILGPGTAGGGCHSQQTAAARCACLLWLCVHSPCVVAQCMQLLLRGKPDGGLPRTALQCLCLKKMCHALPVPLCCAPKWCAFTLRSLGAAPPPTPAAAAGSKPASAGSSDRSVLQAAAGGLCVLWCSRTDGRTLEAFTASPLPA